MCVWGGVVVVGVVVVVVVVVGLVIIWLFSLLLQGFVYSKLAICSIVSLLLLCLTFSRQRKISEGGRGRAGT